MKLKYYMRGLGIGVFVAVLIMSLSVGKKNTSLTDEEIKARAAKLGMVEENLLSDVAKEKLDELEQTTQEAVPEQITENTPEENTEEVTQPVSEEELAEETSKQDEEYEKQSQAEEKKDSVTLKDTEGKVITEEVSQGAVIMVSTGDGSYTVSKKLADAGLIENAAAYDAFLCSKGYDKKITTGNHTIEAGATEEEIAKIITTKSE